MSCRHYTGIWRLTWWFMWIRKQCLFAETCIAHANRTLRIHTRFARTPVKRSCMLPVQHCCGPPTCKRSTRRAEIVCTPCWWSQQTQLTLCSVVLKHIFIQPLMFHNRSHYLKIGFWTICFLVKSRQVWLEGRLVLPPCNSYFYTIFLFIFYLPFWGAVSTYWWHNPHSYLTALCFCTCVYER